MNKEFQKILDGLSQEAREKAKKTYQQIETLLEVKRQLAATPINGTEWENIAPALEKINRQLKQLFDELTNTIIVDGKNGYKDFSAAVNVLAQLQAKSMLVSLQYARPLPEPVKQALDNGDLSIDDLSNNGLALGDLSQYDLTRWTA